MTISRHPFRGLVDLPRVVDLIQRMPPACRHVIDFPWRLSSPTINEGRDAVFWENSDEQVIGFAAWQYYWAALDIYLLPGSQQQAVATDLFAWADQRFRERDAERGKPLPYWVEFRDDDRERQMLAEAHGFVDEEYESYVSLEHSLADLAPIPPLPDGFILRPLAGAQEAAAYAELHRAAFESTSMTAEWRVRTIQMPQHRSDLDLVVVAPDGSLAGFCIGWFAPERRTAQIEPLGVHPRFQMLGLSRILLLAMLHRFQALGATSALVETDLERTPARHAYNAVGFQQTHIIHSKGKWLTRK
jgi:ribosomal protein S18 acetylase RimI-like enzyme